MALPGLVAQPAPFMRTLTTHHVIAPSVLLNTHTTFGTLFCISADPMRSLAIIFAFSFPFSNLLASNWSVCLSVTSKTKSITATALDDFAANHIRCDSIATTYPKSLDSTSFNAQTKCYVYPTWSRAPAHLRIVLNERLCDEAHIFVINLADNQLLNQLFANKQFTRDGRARNFVDLSILNFHGQVAIPTLVAEAVIT